MKKLILILACSAALYGQFVIGDRRYEGRQDMSPAAAWIPPIVTADPSGACLPENRVVMSTASGGLFRCSAGSWSAVVGEGLSGLGTGLTGTLSVPAVDTAYIASITDARAGAVGTCITAGTSTAYTCGTSISWISSHLAAGTIVWVKPHTANGASPTLDLDGAGPMAAIPLKDSTGTAIAASALVSTGPAYAFVYNGTDLIQSGGSSGGSSSVTELSIGYCSAAGTMTPGGSFFSFSGTSEPGLVCDGVGALKLPSYRFLAENNRIATRAIVQSLTPTLELEWSAWANGLTYAIRTTCKAMDADVDGTVTWNADQTATITTSGGGPVRLARTSTALTTTGCAVGSVMLVEIQRAATPTGAGNRALLVGGRVKW